MKHIHINRPGRRGAISLQLKDKNIIWNAQSFLAMHYSSDVVYINKKSDENSIELPVAKVGAQKLITIITVSPTRNGYKYGRFMKTFASVDTNGIETLEFS